MHLMHAQWLTKQMDHNKASFKSMFLSFPCILHRYVWEIIDGIDGWKKKKKKRKEMEDEQRNGQEKKKKKVEAAGRKTKQAATFRMSEEH